MVVLDLSLPSKDGLDILQEIRTSGKETSVVSVGGLKVDTVKRLAYANGKLLKLTAMEFSLLELLVHRKNQVVRRQDVWEQIYEFDCDSDSNVIEVLIGRLRKKLAACGLTSII